MPVETGPPIVYMLWHKQFSGSPIGSLVAWKSLDEPTKNVWLYIQRESDKAIMQKFKDELARISVEIGRLYGRLVPDSM